MLCQSRNSMSDCQWMSHQCRLTSPDFFLDFCFGAGCHISLYSVSNYLDACCMQLLSRALSAARHNETKESQVQICAWMLVQKRHVVKTHQHSAQGRSPQPLSILALCFVTELLICHLHVAHRHSNSGFPYLVSRREPRARWCWIMLISCGNQWMEQTQCDEFVSRIEFPPCNVTFFYLMIASVSLKSIVMKNYDICTD